MKKISNYFYKQSSLPWCILLSIFAALFYFYYLQEAKECFQLDDSSERLSSIFGITHEKITTFFSARSQYQLKCFSEYKLIWNQLFELLLGIVFLHWLSYLLGFNQRKFKSLNLLAIPFVVFAWIENNKLGLIADSYVKSGTIKRDNVITLISILHNTTGFLILILLFFGLLYQIFTYKIKAK